MACFSRTNYIRGFVILLTIASEEAKALNNNGDHFAINGSPFFFTGFISYWMMNVATYPNQRYKVSEVFQDMLPVSLLAEFGLLPMRAIMRCKFHLAFIMNMFFRLTYTFNSLR